MAVTVVDQHALLPGDNRVGFVATIQGDSSYSTGGYAITAASFGLTTLYGIACIGTGPVASRIVSYNQGTGKVLFIQQATGAEVAGATDVSGSVIPVIVYGS